MLDNWYYHVERENVEIITPKTQPFIMLHSVKMCHEISINVRIQQII